MSDELSSLLKHDPAAQEYFSTLPQYVREAIDSNALKISSVDDMRLFAETFMRDDSFRGA